MRSDHTAWQAVLIVSCAEKNQCCTNQLSILLKQQVQLLLWGAELVQALHQQGGFLPLERQKTKQQRFGDRDTL